MVTRTLAKGLRISSIGFSGAGFLASYHLGAVACLQAQDFLSRGDLALPLTGVSAGALVAASIAAGMQAEDGMDVCLRVAEKTRQAGRLSTLQPGFSLVDATEQIVREKFIQAVDGDNDEFLRRIQHGKLLRIGLTDRRVWPPLGQNPQAACYVDQYRDIDDVVAACVLSSYIPGVTGPSWGNMAERHKAIWRSTHRLQEMVKLGYVKKGPTGEPLAWSEISSDMREFYWDGGLVNAFPILDRDTLIVTPIAADFVNESINPSIEYRNYASGSSQGSNFPASIQKTSTGSMLKIHRTAANLHTFQSLILNPDESKLQSFYEKGYDNAYAFLHKHGLLQVFRRGHQATTT